MKTVNAILKDCPKKIVYHLTALNDKFRKSQQVGGHRAQVLAHFSAINKFDETASLQKNHRKKGALTFKFRYLRTAPLIKQNVYYYNIFLNNCQGLFLKMFKKMAYTNRYTLFFYPLTPIVPCHCNILKIFQFHIHLYIIPFASMKNCFLSVTV
jgi:hypothetical protein